MERLYHSILREHLGQNRQMAFVVGPRQVGKTTLCRESASESSYLLWDRRTDRTVIVHGPDAVAEHIGLTRAQAKKPVVIFDEIHKYGKWKDFLKGFFDVYGSRTRIIVTGSARLDVYKKGGDSLMGRYFLYRIHPLSVGELVRTDLSETETHPPTECDASTYERLLRFGGFPEPFLRAEHRFANRWKRLRRQQLFREDVRDLTQVQDLDQLEMLAEILRHQSASHVNYSKFATDVNVSVDTIRRWLTLLESLYYSFRVRPWFRNVPKSLRKEPKIYVWDWSTVDDPGRRLETFMAVHLLKAVQWWEDAGLGEYTLHYLRDKEKREVDLLVVRNGKPWFLVEVKTSDKRSLNPALKHFQRCTGAEHAFQVAFDADFIHTDCFERREPVIVPAKTFLSQLV